jgi:anti-sigma factor RsiW
MKLDDILLMTYVDGELPPQERQQVETEIASSPDIAERVALITALCLAYREAFAHIAVRIELGSTSSKRDDEPSGTAARSPS